MSHTPESRPSRRRVLPIVAVAALLAVAAAVVVVRFVLPGGDPAVRFVLPAASEVPAGEPFTIEVEVTNARVASSISDRSGGHLHLYVDGELRQMPYSTRAEVTLDPGPHTLRVEYVDFEHVSFSPEIDAEIEVTAR